MFCDVLIASKKSIMLKKFNCVKMEEKNNNFYNFFCRKIKKKEEDSRIVLNQDSVKVQHLLEKLYGFIRRLSICPLLILNACPLFSTLVSMRHFPLPRTQ
jgi:hypothetical protein